VAAGSLHSVARRNDGSIVAWGDNEFGQCNVPGLPPGLTYVEVAAGYAHSVARRSDGSLVAWGLNAYGECNVPALPRGLTYVEIAASGDYPYYGHTIARRSDGSVVAWGNNLSGQCNVPALPAGLTYVEISTGAKYGVARRSDGSVVAWGDNAHGQCNVPALPVGLTYVEIKAGYDHTLARRSDGSVVAWGNNYYGQCNIPALPAGLVYAEVAAGDGFSVARIQPSEAVTPFCFGDGLGATCPCGNAGLPGRGCENSAGTGGAWLTVEGVTHPDSIVLTSSGELPQALSIFLQGDATIAPTSFGDGLRCAGGHLKRLYVKNARSGAASAPQAGDPPITVRSADLGDPIPPGSIRYYQTYYRDPDLAFCPAPQGDSWNATNGVIITW
jgi:hypothetical protein